MTQNITPAYFFRTPIWHMEINNHQDLNLRLKEAILKLKEEYSEGVSLSNDGGWQSPAVLQEHSDFADILSTFSDLLDMAIRKTYRLNDNQIPVIESFWANVNHPLCCNTAHVHANSIWSAAYYVETPENCGNICFHDPRPGAQMTNTPDNFAPEITASDISIPAQAGRLIFFPSYMLHNVEVNRSNSDRISMSFNAGIAEN